jgi:Zn-dependent protease with chaperone function
MFIARGILVCLAFFVVMYAALSCLVASGWWMWQRSPWRHRALTSPFALFGLRVSPLAASVLSAVFFIFPSFWLMEARSFDEDATTFLLAICGLTIVGFAIVRVFYAKALTTHVVKQWLAKPMPGKPTGLTSISAAKGAPALVLVGVLSPRIMISDLATSVLSRSELRVAIRHELAHRHSRDNVKKALMNAIPFPGMRAIETAWREAAELAADRFAVRTRQEALDLAAALIKLSRSPQPSMESTFSSGILCESGTLTLRIRRLVEWHASPNRLAHRWVWGSVIGVAAIAVASHYGSMLALTHRLTEIVAP